MSLSPSLVSISDFNTELTFGKLIVKSGSGFVIVPFNPIITSTGITLLKDAFSINTAGFAVMFVETASRFNIALYGLPSQTMDPYFFTENCLSITPPYLKL